MPATQWVEEGSIWWADERSRAWHILPPCLFNLWRHGTHCHCGIQKHCLPHCWEVTTNLQPDPVPAEMQAELLDPVLSHHVPQRCTLIDLSSSWTIRDWRAHRPDLLIESNLSPRLAKWTYITLSNSIQPLTACCAKLISYVLFLRNLYTPQCLHTQK